MLQRTYISSADTNCGTKYPIGFLRFFRNPLSVFKGIYAWTTSIIILIIRQYIEAFYIPMMFVCEAEKHCFKNI